jgi:hypothetical protein
MFRRIFALFVGLAVSCAALAEDTTSALINQALDKPTKLTLNALLPQAMEQIQQQTDVPIKADPAVWDILPWGRGTNIHATIDNQTLRQALEAITRKLGLQFEIKADALVLQPMPALRRLARRSTAQELTCLEILSNEKLSTSGSMTLKAMLDAVDAQLAAAKSTYAIDRPAGEIVPMSAEINVARNSTLLDALEAMTKQSSATWYPWGKTVVVLGKQEQIKRQLTRTITVRYSGADLAQVLSDLSQKANVPFDIESGAIQALSPESRTINLILEDYSIHDALESIRGTTGLDFMVREGGVYLWNQATSPMRRDRVLITMPVHGSDMVVLIPESQVPQDIRDYIAQKSQKQFDNIRQMMSEEGFKPPTTQPTTKPSTTTVKTNQDL